MDRKQVALLALLGALIVAVFMLSVGIGSTGNESVDPEQANGIDAIDSGVGAVPGIGTPLRAADVDVGCFDGGRFVIASGPCGFAIAEGIDRVELTFESGLCTIAVTDQDDVLDQRVDRGDFGDDGRGRLALTGNGAVVTISPLGTGGCSLRLEGDDG